MHLAKPTVPFALSLIALLLSLTAPASPARASAFVVFNTADSGAGSLRQAMLDANAAVGADSITFSLSGCPCTIVLTGGALPTVTGDLTIVGPGAGSLAISGNGSSRIFAIDAGVTVRLDGMTLANGAVGSPGGGAVLNSGTLTIRNSVVLGSHVDLGDGGGLSNSGTLTITNSSFSDNVAGTGSGGGSGGAISNTGLATITGSTFSGNHVGGFSGGSGGAISNEGTMTVTDSTISGNGTSGESSAAGGGIANSGVLTIGSSTFAGNSTSGRLGGVGGGISSTGTLAVTNSTFSGNSASSGQPGASSGGGVSNGGGLTATNSTFSANSAAVGGGLAQRSGTATLRNTIVANSPSGGDCASPGTGSVVDGGHNLVEDNSCGFAGGADPLLASGASNGGPTQTLALRPGSPAIDAGDNSACAAPPVNNRDQRGVSRPVDGDGNGTAICDVGAYEAPNPGTVLRTQTATGTTTPATTTPVATISTTVTPPAGATLTPQERTQQVVDSIAALATAGELNKGQANALRAKLDAAQRAFGRGNTNAACGELGAFANQVEAFVRAGTLSPSQGQDLIGPVGSLCSP